MTLGGWLLLALLAGGAVPTAAGVRQSLPAAPARASFDFNRGWRLAVGDPPGAETPAFADDAWKPVTLPHAFNEDDAFRKDIRDLPTGIVWYRKRFRLPAGSRGKKVVLEFEGIRHGGEFYVNGKSVGRHENGVMAFGLDITGALLPPPQENVIAARIDNSWNYKETATGSGYQWSDRNFYANYGGINKNVRLHVMDRLYQTLPLYSNLGTTGVYVHATNFDVPGGGATVTAESQVRNEYDEPRTFRYDVSIVDAAGKTVRTFGGKEERIGPNETRTVSANARVTGLRFWSWGYGCLYDVRTTLTVNGRPADAVTTRTGFR
ncbi:MAG: sugar-binding domain-containing protein, partial [Armatimonadota bacterium]